MFKMKRLVILFLIVIGVNGWVSAQQNKMPTPTEIAQKNVDDLDKRLKLNATQKSVIYSFTFNQAKEQADLIKRQQAGNSREEDVDKFYKLQNETTKNIRNVLRPEQQAEYDKVIEERLSGKGLKGKNKKKKKGEEEEVESDIKGLLSGPPVEKQNQ
jgi:protein CpxP